MKKFFILIFLFLQVAFVANADTWKEHLKQTWTNGEWNLYVPANVWHNRLTYSHEKIDEFNERPWGIGFGKQLYDEDDDLHSYVAMVFLDSHKDPEPIVGYQFQKKWYADEDKFFSLGLGYSMGLTARSDYDYIPFPYIAPILALQVWRFSIENTYIPGTGSNGNVLFTWVRVEF